MSAPRVDPFDLYERTRRGDDGTPAELLTNSPSLLNDADICLRRAVYKKTRPQGASEASICGNGYHAGLEEYYHWRMGLEAMWAPGAAELLLPEDMPNWPAPAPEIVERCYGAAHAEIYLRTPDDFEWDTSFEETVNRAQQMIHAYFAGGHYWPADYRILGVEVGFVVPSAVDGWADKGFIDLVVLQDGTGLTILDDHKTAGKPWKSGKESARKNNQPAMYDSSWELATGVKPDAFCFSIMTYAGQFERRMIRVQQPARDLVVAKELTMLPLLKQGIEGTLSLPGNTQSGLCSPKYCDHWHECPFGAAKN